MRLTFRRSVLCACLALVAGCGDEGSGAGLGKLGSDLKTVGDKAATEAKDAGGKMAEQAKGAGAAMSTQLAEAGSSLSKLASDAAAGMSMKGDELSKMLSAKLPELNKVVATVKEQLAAKGGALKDMIPGLTTKQDGFAKSLEALTKSGANAGADLKKSALDAFSSLTAGLNDAMAKLKG